MNKKICLVSSPGGHLEQILQLEPICKKYEYFFIVNDIKYLRRDILERTHFITKSQRDWKFFINLIEAFRIFYKERPSVIISTGAGCAIPVSLVGKFIFECKVIYIESFASVYRPTLTGRIMYYIADLFIYQWEYLRQYFQKGILGGPIF